MAIDATQDIAFLGGISQSEIEEEMASAEHGYIGANLIEYLAPYVRQTKLGKICTAQTSFKVVGIPATRQPDVAFIVKNRLPANPREELKISPDLAVEIVSPTDRTFDILAKVEQYLKSGVPLIWVIVPFSQTVEIYRLATGLVPQVIGINGELDGEDVIPGFKLGVSLLFDY